MKINQFNTSDINSEKGIGANSLDLSSGGHFLTKTAGIITKAVTGGEICGTNITQKVFSSDNQTVDAVKVEFYPSEIQIRYEVEITGGSVTELSNKYFDLSDSETVDGTTASATTGQLKLVEFISATKGVFVIVNK